MSPHACIGCGRNIDDRYDLCEGCTGVFSDLLDQAAADVIAGAEELLEMTL